MTNEQTALIKVLVTLKTIADNAPVLSMKNMALEAAGNCVWGLGYDELHGVMATIPIKTTITLDNELSTLKG